MKKSMVKKRRINKRRVTRETEALQIGMKQQSIIELRLQRFVSWAAMLILILTNFLAAVLLVPFLLFFEGVPQYIIIVLFGVGFGLLFNLMIHSIEHIGDKHHIIAGVLVPCFALLDVVILFGIVEKAKEMLKIEITYSYPLIVILFISAFLIPYLTDILRQKHKF